MGLLPKQVENSPPGKIIRKTSRAATGGAALFVAFMAVMLFRHGLGTGGSGTSGTNPADSPQPAVAMGPQSPTGPQSTTPAKDVAPKRLDPSLTSDEKHAIAGNVLTILIDEHDFLIQIMGGDSPVYRPAELPRVITLAALTQGDANGIRVHIKRRENARASAEEKLKLELAHSRIPSGAIHMAEEFVP
jgi:hypothetical protein